jgi:hypothetical protein
MRSFRDALIIFVVALSILVYFMTRSTTYDPLKSFQFPLTKEELRGQLFQTINAGTNWTIKLTDSTGTDNKLNYYCDIVYRDEANEYKYYIKYKKENSFWDSNVKSEIDLIGAFDIRHKTGGYKTEDTDVDKLTDIFEKEVIKRLSKNTSR